MYDVIIIGAGPAGLTSAVYTSRAGLKTLILEKGAPGGKIFLTHLIENYPGYDSIGGRELSTIMHKHALKFGAEYAYGDVLDIVDGNIKEVVTNNGNYQAKTIIVATGMQNRKLGAPGEDEFAGRGVSYCAVCDGNFFKEQDVVVIGGGNSALEEALYLADLCSSVTIVHRRDEFRAEQFIVDNVLNNKKIKLELDSVVEEIIGEEKVEAVKVKNVKSGDIKSLDTKGVFIYVGLVPVTSPFENLGILADDGFIPVDKNMKTKLEGIYAAGDVIPKDLRQITTAVNDGAIAAQSIVNYLK